MDIYEIRKQLGTGKTIYDLELKVTFYARVSTDKDEQLHSLGAQVRYYTQFIRGCPNWTLVGGYVDEGISGTTAGKRENFLRMISDAGSGHFDFIVTKEISRFSRSTLDSIRYTQELLRCGVGVFFESDNINTLMPDAELRLTIMSSIAQDEVRKLSERVKFGFKRAIENGVVLGSNRIWGYEKDNGRLVVKPDEAEVVRLIFDWYANQMVGVRTIARYLNESGYRNLQGNPFTFTTIRSILGNPKYKGYYCGHKTSKVDYKMDTIKRFSEDEWVMYKDEEHVPPIVSEELWDRANTILKRRSAKQSAKDKGVYQNRYAYSGKILCGVHNLPYYRELYRYPSGDKEIWQCQEYSRKGRRGCTMPVLYTLEADEIVRKVLAEVSFDRAELVCEMIGLYRCLGNESRIDEDMARCRTEIEEILLRKDRLLDLSIAGRITDDEFSQRNKRFNGQLDELGKQLETLREGKEKNRDMLASAEALGDALARELEFREGFTSGVIDALLDHIEVHPQQEGEKSTVRVSAYLKVWKDVSRDFTIRRRRGKPSECWLEGGVYAPGTPQDICL